MLNPFVDLFSTIIQLYNYVLITWVILSLLINFEVVNRFNPLVQRVNDILNRLVEPVLRPIRRLTDRFLPNLGGVDLSPIVLFLLLQFIQNALYSWFYTV